MDRGTGGACDINYPIEKIGLFWMIDIAVACSICGRWVLRTACLAPYVQTLASPYAELMLAAI